MALRDELLTYLDRIAQPGAVDAIADIEGVDAAVEAAAGVLHEAIRGGGATGHDALSSALTWVRDASIGVGSKQVKAGARTSVRAHLMPALAEALVAPVWWIRREAIYTLGKMTFPEDARLLSAVFARYADDDPLLVPNLVDELAWLGGDAASLRARMRAHPSYLTRWAFFGTQAGEPHAADAECEAACVELVDDPSEHVRAEARYVGEALRLRAAIAASGRRDAAGRELRRRRRALERAAPLRFETMCIRFFNQLAEPAYEVSQVDAFVRSFAGAPT